MFKREEAWEYPPDAIREAIVNALIHRDYWVNGNIRVGIYDDRVEITNPGELLEPLTPKMLKKEHESILRNPFLANAFFLTRDIEQWGRGTNKIVDWCVGHGLKEPDFEEIGGGFMVKFHAPEDILALVPDKTRVDLREFGLNERQIEALKLMVNEEQIFTNKKYREMFKVSRQTATRDLSNLVKKGQIHERGAFKDRVYFHEAYSGKMERKMRRKTLKNDAKTGERMKRL